MIDASFASRAQLPTQRLDEAAQLLEELLRSHTRLVAPVMLAVEFASTLRKLHSRGLLTSAERRARWQEFNALPIEFVWHPGWVDRALEIAEAAGLSKIYDSIYLACAEAFGFELLTCDARFARAARPLSTAAIRLVGHR